MRQAEKLRALKARRPHHGGGHIFCNQENITSEIHGSDQSTDRPPRQSIAMNRASPFCKSVGIAFPTIRAARKTHALGPVQRPIADAAHRVRSPRAQAPTRPRGASLNLPTIEETPTHCIANLAGQSDCPHEATWVAPTDSSKVHV